MLVFSVIAMACTARSADVGPFFEPTHPFFHSQVEVVPPKAGGKLAENFVVRGILLPLASGHCVVFDQELLRVAGIWEVPPQEPPVTLKTMAQTSYASPRRKAGSEHPRPAGELLLTTAVHPGIGANREALFSDPRPPNVWADAGRGPLPPEIGRFEGIELADNTAVLRYVVDRTRIREWHEGRTRNGNSQLLRHLEVAPHNQALHVVIGATREARWSIERPDVAVSRWREGKPVTVVTNSPGVVFSERGGELIATLPASPEAQRVSVVVYLGGTPGNASLDPTPETPVPSSARRWPHVATAPATLGSLEQNGLILDRIALPDDNPWQRRVRAADLAFVTDDRAAVLTYDGDVWLVEGFSDPALAKMTWRRFASGLHEPLAIAHVRDVGFQVATKNGVVRLHDRDGNGEADWVENFNDHMIQSQTTRSFPLDMGIGPDGATYVSQGGIVSRSGIQSGGDGTPHTGGVLKISADGRASELFAAALREPFVTVHPKTGVVTATDQQGHYIPSSVAYLVRRGDHFGYLQPNPPKLTPALAWLPHDQDISSSSQTWILGEGMEPWNGKLLHLSYGTGRMFIISPDLDAPIPQAAVIPLDLKTDLPLLHARMNPRGDAVFLAGFQIWGTRTTTRTALGRLRRGTTPTVTAVSARSLAEGVVLDFAEPLDAASLKPENVFVRAWNYKRSSAYGSGRYTLEGPPGATPWGVAQTVLSTNRKSVFIHLPSLAPANQVQVRYEFAFASGIPARGQAYFTIHRPAKANLAKLGFSGVNLQQQVAVIAREREPLPTPASGRTIAENLGCLACHSVDGSTEGKVGPTWRGLFGARRKFIDGTSEVADELYLREKILDPQQKKLKPGQVEMPSYRGVMTEQQLEAVVLYLRSIGLRLDPTDK